MWIIYIISWFVIGILWQIVFMLIGDKITHSYDWKEALENNDTAIIVSSIFNILFWPIMVLITSSVLALQLALYIYLKLYKNKET
jgi:hypothetical protein